MIRFFNIIIIFSLVLANAFSSCKKFVETTPPVTSTTSATAYTIDATAAAVLTGVYTTMAGGNNYVGGGSSISLLTGLSSDELTLYDGSSDPILKQFYINALTNQTESYSFWQAIYSNLHTVNSAIEGLDLSTGLTPSIKQQLQGEAKFLRALFLFYLTNLYGDIPLVTFSDYRVNAVLTRSSKQKVYQQIIDDLTQAIDLLSDNYLGSNIKTVTDNRVRPNKWAATALLARVYLYNADWAKAEEQANSIIANTSKYNLLSDLNSVFTKNSLEAIWQLQPVTDGSFTSDAYFFILSAGPQDFSNPVYLSSRLIDAFEVDDQRKNIWIGIDSSTGTNYYYPFKYKLATQSSPFSEYIMVLRLAEQYLIRAEARARLGDLPGAVEDLNRIRQRSGLTALGNPASQAPLLSAILHERKVELFCEWGHRWFDLKRTNMADDAMNVETPLKGGTWNSTDQLYPLPLYELQQNKNLDQNAGY